MNGIGDGTTYDHATLIGFDGQTGRLKSITHGNPFLGFTPKTFSQSYVANSNLVDDLTAPAHTVSNAWESHRNVLKSKTHDDRATNPNSLSSIAYGSLAAGSDAVNAIGQRLEAHRTLQGASLNQEEWGYNGNGEVVSADHDDLAKDRDYSYDRIGNRVSSGDSTQQIAYTPDALNQYDQITTTPTGGSATTVTKVHDDDGNLTDDGSKLYEWDAENRLVALRRKSDNLLIAKYRYDYLSRRIYKETSSIAAQGATTHIFTYEGWNLCAEYEASAINGTTNAAITSLKRTYTWGTDLSGSLQGAGGVGGLLAVEEKSGTHAAVYYPLYDGNGNVTEIVKEASGGAATLVAHYE
jgi:hypothetical protein